jgi:hypothetical protein
MAWEPPKTTNPALLSIVTNTVDVERWANAKTPPRLFARVLNPALSTFCRPAPSLDIPGKHRLPPQ